LGLKIIEIKLSFKNAMKLRKKDFNFIIYAIILTTVGCFLLQQPKSKVKQQLCRACAGGLAK
jgi:hypothetical protein